jgi:hypothetical protein
MSLYAIDAIQIIIAALRGDADVSALTDTIAASLAPQASQMPYLVVSVASDAARHSLCRAVVGGTTYVSVRAVAASVAQAKALADAACAALAGEEIEGEGGTKYGVSYRSAFSYPDPAQTGGTPPQHVGAIYAVTYQPV